MSGVWTRAIKSVDLSGHTDAPHPQYPSPGFVPAPLRRTIGFSPAMLYAALAKTTALSSVDAALMAALIRSDQAFIEAITDEAGSDFLFTSAASHLGADVRKALAGRIGAALCHLYMDGLGYAWVDYAGAHMRHRGPLGDFLYDGAGLGSPGLALAEAKGSLRAAASAAQVETVADRAYARQVSPHLGAVTAAGRIEYGCAIATAILPAEAWTPGSPSCFLHVTQTAPWQAAGGPGAPRPDRDAEAGDEAVGDETMVSCLLALRDYRALFRLIGAPFIADLLDRLIDERPLTSAFVQRFGRLEPGPVGRADWIVGDPGDHPAQAAYDRANRLANGTRFALHRRSFEAIVAVIRRCAENRALLSEPIRLPNLARRDQPRERAETGRRALLGDGLAVVESWGWHYSEEDDFRWPG